MASRRTNEEQQAMWDGINNAEVSKDIGENKTELVRESEAYLAEMSNIEKCIHNQPSSTTKLQGNELENFKEISGNDNKKY